MEDGEEHDGANCARRVVRASSSNFYPLSSDSFAARYAESMIASRLSMPAIAVYSTPMSISRACTRDTPACAAWTDSALAASVMGPATIWGMYHGLLAISVTSPPPVSAQRPCG